MSLTAIIILILIGVLLLLLEILVIPGVTVAGIAGFACMIAGVFFAYKSLGLRDGNIVLLSTVILNLLVVFYAFRTKTWRKIGLEKSIVGKVNKLEVDIKEGDEGTSISRLAPSGKAMFGEKMIEVHSQVGYVDSNTDIYISKIKNNKVFIKIK